MIKLLDASFAGEFKEMLLHVDRVMGRDINYINPVTGTTIREHLTETITSGWCQWQGAVTRRSIGWFHNNELHSVLLQDFSTTVKAWSINYYLCRAGSTHTSTAAADCLDYAITEAEKFNYYEYYQLIPATDYKTVAALYENSKLQSKYLMALDEIIPPWEKSVSSLTWDWLFEGNSRGIDMAIIKGFLKPKYRPNY